MKKISLQIQIKVLFLNQMMAVTFKTSLKMTRVSSLMQMSFKCISFCNYFFLEKLSKGPSENRELNGNYLKDSLHLLCFCELGVKKLIECAIYLGI